MIEIILDTGNYFTGENFFNQGSVFNGVGSIDYNQTLLSEIDVNGKVLHETIPVSTVIGLKTFFVNSGECFLSGFELKNETGRFPLPPESELYYQILNTGERYFATGDNYLANFTGAYGGGDIFLNGQKLTSGDGYIVDGDWVFLGNNNITGSLFTTQNKVGDYSTGVYDRFGIYNLNGITAYLNGMKMGVESFIQVGDVVSDVLETGLEPIVEFNFPKQGSTIFM